MKQQTIGIKGFIKNSIVPVFLLVYFVRFAIPQGSFYIFSPTVLFYGFTLIFVVGYLVIIGVIGVVGVVQMLIHHNSLSSRHKMFLFISSFGLVLFSISLGSRHAYMYKKFDTALWNGRTALDSNFISIRQKMMDDLSKNVLPGLSKSEIVPLLGTPDYVWLSEEGEWGYWQPGKEVGDFMYIIGLERGIGIDNECLLIQFDENDVVIDSESVSCG